MGEILSTSAPGIRSSTAESYVRALERVVSAMEERLDEPLSLKDLAEIAFISPYHFDRVFRRMIGIPPCQFLGALRIEKAKSLLLTTRLRVTDICYEVGYNSLGTFLTRFNQLVGLSPRRLRRRALDADSVDDDLAGHFSNGSPGNGSRKPGEVAGLSGYVDGPQSFEGTIFIGLFPAPIPQCRPVGCAVLAAPGAYHISDVPDGNYYVLAAGFPHSDGNIADVLVNKRRLWVGSRADPVTFEDGQADSSVDIELRPIRPLDPPLLMIPPLLIGSWSAPVGGRTSSARRQQAQATSASCGV